MNKRFLNLFFIFILTVSIFAQWSENEFCVSSPNINPDQNAFEFFDDGSFIMIWSDSHSGIFEIYAQRFDSESHPLWPETGFKISNTDGNNVDPVLAKTSGNEIVVVWENVTKQDLVYNFTINTARINSNGDIIYPPSRNTYSSNSSRNKKITADNNNGFYLISEDIKHQKYLQHFNNLNIPYSEPDDVDSIIDIQSTIINNDNTFYSVIPDTTADFYSGKLYLNKYSDSGILLWSSLITTENRDPALLGLIKIDNHIFVMWKDLLSSKIQKFTEEGQSVWETPLGLPVNSFFPVNHLFKINESSFLAFQDNSQSNMQLWKIDTDGNILWNYSPPLSSEMNILNYYLKCSPQGNISLLSYIKSDSDLSLKAF